MRQIGDHDYIAGATTMLEGARLAAAAGDFLRAGRFYNAAGSAYLLANGFRDAMDCLRQALSHARRALARQGNPARQDRAAAQDLIAAASVNLASLYLEMEDPELAEQLLLEAAADLRPSHPFEPQFFLLRARVLEQNSDLSGALVFLAKAEDAADRELNWDIHAAALHWRGIVLSRLGRFEDAEACLLEAFRERILHRKSGLEINLRRLAMLELERGNAARAHDYIRIANQRRSAASMPDVDWRTNTVAGHVLNALGREREALQAYRRALSAAARWRSALIPSFTILTESDVTISELALSHAQLTAQLADSSGSRELAAESLVAVVRHRASSLLRLQSRHTVTDTIGPEYRSLVSRLRRLEMSTRPEDDFARRRLRRQAAEMETRILPGYDFGHTGPASDRELLHSLRRALPKGSTAIVFLFGEQRSWRWVLGPTTLQLRRLPPGPQLEASIDRLRDSLGESELTAAGALLLSGLPREALAANQWLFSLDGPLFDVPFCALRLPEEGTQPVVAGRSVQVVPALLALLQPRRRWKPGPLLAVADAIYNRADPRLPKHGQSGIPLAFGLWQDKSPQAAQLERPRLAASLQEAQAVRAFWTGLGQPDRFLTGQAVEAHSLGEALSANPSVIHLATHVELPAGRKTGDNSSPGAPSSIVLSLQPDGTAGLLRPEALMRLQLPASVVVMSGCDSSRGKVRPGLGLTGLSQAWLIGGASAVAGSLWPVRDEASPLFVSFYRALAAGLNPARALRQAQMEAIRAGGPHADPSYWAAWTLTGM